MKRERVLITGNMGYVGPLVVEQLREHVPGVEIIGLDSGYFAHCLTGIETLPETAVDLQIFSDVRDFARYLLHTSLCIPYVQFKLLDMD